MTDYIDRQAAIAYAISGRIRTLPTSEDGENWIRTAEVRQSLLDVPSADVEPVKHGRWINAIYDMEFCFAECDQCHNKATGIGEYTGNSFYYRFHRYCPNCGAKMKGLVG